MAGNHELIPAVIDEPASPELFLCGDRTTMATRGRARFALTALLMEPADASADSEIRDMVTSGARYRACSCILFWSEFVFK